VERKTRLTNYYFWCWK